VRLLRPGNLPSSEFVTWEPKDTICLPEKWVAFAPDYVVRGSELIMNLTAQSLEEQFLGRVCMTQAGDFCLLNQRLARFRPLDCDLRFLFWSLRGPVFRRQIDKNPQGTKVQHIYDRDLRAVHLPVPKDPAEQTKIVNILFGFANHIGAEQCLAQKLDSIRLGLRADLVTGRVRVPESIFASGSLA
jgi:type I restriction enzyme S subunit